MNGVLESAIRKSFKKENQLRIPHKANHQANVISRIDLNSFFSRKL